MVGGRFHGRLVVFLCSLMVLGGMFAWSGNAIAASGNCGSGLLGTGLNNNGVASKAETCSRTPKSTPDQGADGSEVVLVVEPKFDYRTVLSCPPERLSDAPGGEATNCSHGMTACELRNPPEAGPMFRIERRPHGQNGAAWTLVREVCGQEKMPPGVPAPPAIPTLAQIQNAFRQLPFSKPRVGIEPEGNKTLVNLPTYFRAEWPGDAGLQPGEVSAPVQLLTWSVEFRIAARSYDFHYGDGSSSGPTTDPGGVYPDGAIRHTYTEPTAGARVSVDAQLTAQYRANGGPWQDIDSVADLQDEPVTTLQVREAHARLVTH